jgi:hypothetical protein
MAAFPFFLLVYSARSLLLVVFSRRKLSILPVTQDLVNLVLQPKQQQSFHCFPFNALLLTLPRWADADYENLWEQ